MKPTEIIRQKIDKLIEEKGFTYKDISKKLGRDSSYIFQFIKRGVPQRLNEVDRLKLSRILHVEEQELTDLTLPKTKASIFYHNEEIEHLKKVIAAVVDYDRENEKDWTGEAIAIVALTVYTSTITYPVEQRSDKIIEFTDLLAKQDDIKRLA